MTNIDRNVAFKRLITNIDRNVAFKWLMTNIDRNVFNDKHRQKWSNKYFMTN